MRFEAEKFYAHDTSEYEFTDNSITLLYCRKIRNDGLEIAELIDLDGMLHLAEVEMSPWYKEISKSEFAEKLLEVAIKGKDYLSSTINEMNRAELERKEKEEEAESGILNFNLFD